MARQKVAITTWFHYHNYGTALQVVAVSEAIKSLGYQTDVVNYIPHGTRYSDEKATDWSDLERVSDDARSGRFDKFITKNLSFTRPCSSEGDFEGLNAEYDAFVAGSDQVWSPIVFDPRYYLDYVADNRKKIGYAPSMGVSHIQNQDIKQRMADLMSQFAHLSAREEAGQNLIESITSRKPELVLDPTFLLEYSAWRKIIPESKKLKKAKYILCYFLGDNEKSWEHAQKISEETGLPIKILPVFTKDQQYGEFQMAVGPEEFFNLIDGAEMVLTDSFHGIIFSMLCSKQFYAFERFRANDPLSQNSRVYNILNFTDQKARLISYDEAIRARYSQRINYNAVNKILKEKRNESLSYLKSSLQISEPLVSIIVPVYNVEEYIEKCLDSILGQTYRNLEIIVVDDGTPDRSADIADAYAKKDDRLKVLHHKNGGLSVARNRGYEAAHGKYILFVDSDDALAPDAVTYMLGLIENMGANFAASLNRYDVFEQNQINQDKFMLIKADDMLEGIEYNTYPQEVWNKIYRKSFLDENNIRHIPEILYGEGNTFNHYVLSCSGDVAVGYRRVYYYRYNPDSSTRKFVWGPRMQSFEYALKHRQNIVNNKRSSIRIAFGYHKWSAGMHVLKGILSIDGQRQYAASYRQWRRILRSGVFGTLLADNSTVSAAVKQQAVKSFFFPKKTLMPYLDGFEWERAQREAFSHLKSSEFDVMPWEKLSTKNDKTKTDIPLGDPTIEGLQEENARLSAELESFMSIKRSLKLFLGNIRRRIKYGKNR